jgi:hypothetical protein
MKPFQLYREYDTGAATMSRYTNRDAAETGFQVALNDNTLTLAILSDITRGARLARFDKATMFRSSGVAPECQALPVPVVEQATIAATFAPRSKSDRWANAKAQGFERDDCRECGNFTLVRNGTCMKCNTCGSTSGCS